ncbi:hypothetical protein, partial [Gimesia alba]|uniref:hypothetical protein n=1 Tax=Gimesia alba TaxID=2527973 RepID=UPI001E3B3ACF
QNINAGTYQGLLGLKSLNLTSESENRVPRKPSINTQLHTASRIYVSSNNALIINSILTLI